MRFNSSDVLSFKNFPKNIHSFSFAKLENAFEEKKKEEKTFFESFQQPSLNYDVNITFFIKHHLRPTSRRKAQRKALAMRQVIYRKWAKAKAKLYLYNDCNEYERRTANVINIKTTV